MAAAVVPAPAGVRRGRGGPGKGASWRAGSGDEILSLRRSGVSPAPAAPGPPRRVRARGGGGGDPAARWRPNAGRGRGA